MTCPFAHDDGAYLLGALAPAERNDFERHLAGCPDCIRAVGELAGLVGLLARVPATVLDGAAPEAGPLEAGSQARSEALPATLLGDLVREVRRMQRRRAWTTAGVTAAAAVAVTAGTLGVTGALDLDGGRGGASTGPGASVAAGAEPRPMLPVGAEAMSADLALTSVPWGTRLDLSCRYAGGADPGESAGSTYALVVRTRDGRVERVATWRALPGRTMRLAAATATRRQDIVLVEVRDAGGAPVLTLTG